MSAENNPSSSDDPLQSLAQLRHEMDRFRTVVDDQHRRDEERRIWLEDELLLTKQRLAAAEDELHSSRGGSHHTAHSSHMLEDPFLPASERHRLSSNPRPDPYSNDPPRAAETPWSRWNPLKFFPTPFQERDGSFEYWRARAESPPHRAPTATIPGAFTPTPGALGLRGGARAPGGIFHSPHLLSPSPIHAPARPSNPCAPVRADLNAPVREQDIGDPHGDRPRDLGDPRKHRPRLHHDSSRVYDRDDYDRGYSRRDPTSYDDRYDPLRFETPFGPGGRDDLGPKLKPEDISTFDGENVEFFIASCMSFAALYGDVKDCGQGKAWATIGNCIL